MRPRRRKCSLTWGLILEDSWLRSEQHIRKVCELRMTSSALWRFKCLIVQDSELGSSPAGGAEARQTANCERNQEEDSGRETQATSYWEPEGGRPEVSLNGYSWIFDIGPHFPLTQSYSNWWRPFLAHCMRYGASPSKLIRYILMLMLEQVNGSRNSCNQTPVKKSTVDPSLTWQQSIRMTLSVHRII